MTAADWQPLRDLGFDDQGLLEAAHVIAIFNYFPDGGRLRAGSGSPGARGRGDRRAFEAGGVVRSGRYSALW